MVEWGEDAEFDPPPQGGLADEQAGQRAAGVQAVVGEHADGFELGGSEHVRLVDGQDRDASASGVLAGERSIAWGVRAARRVFGHPAERGDDGVVDAADADGGVAEVDEGVPGGVQGARAARRATVFPAPTSPVMTPRACSLMHQLIRAAASAWAPWRLLPSFVVSV